MASSCTVLAWCQKELHDFIELFLIPPLTDISFSVWADGKALLCLAHRYYPESIEILTNALQADDTLTIATEIFEDHLFITWTGPEQWIEYLTCLYIKLSQGLDQLRELAVGSVDCLEKFAPLQLKWKEIYNHVSVGEPHHINSLAVSRDLCDFRAFINTLPIDVRTHPTIAANISVIYATHAAVNLQLHKGGVLSLPCKSTLYNELDFIQAKMLNSTMNDSLLSDLERRTTEIGDVLNNLSAPDDSLLDKHRSIVMWVHDIRAWLTETERVRIWIQDKVNLLESKPVIDALYDVEIKYRIEEIDTLSDEQQALEKEIDIFDSQEMSKLKSHVKSLTSIHRGDLKMTPADIATLEVAFTALVALDQLMHLVRRHGYDQQILSLRMSWEWEYQKASTWLEETNEEVKAFIYQRARWRSDPAGKLTKESIIEHLLKLEKKVSDFEQGHFVTTVHMYQDLDDACKVRLPAHLESRQIAVEENFEEQLTRVGFARQIVEQHLVVIDFLEQAEKLQMQGEQLKEEISLAEKRCLSGKEFNERVTAFQDSAIRLATNIASRVPYPETNNATGQEENEDANQVIRMMISTRKSALILFGETLDQSLSSYRRALQHDNRAKQLQKEMERISNWISERIQSVNKSNIDVFVDKCSLNQSDLIRLEKERDGQITKMNSIKQNDKAKLMTNIQNLESCQPQRKDVINSLKSGVEEIELQLDILDTSLKKYNIDLDVLGRLVLWESQYTKTIDWMNQFSNKLWRFVSDKAQWRPTTLEATSHSVLDDIHKEFEIFQHDISVFQNNDMVAIDSSFKQLSNGFHLAYNKQHGFEPIDQVMPMNQKSVIPGYVQHRQDDIKKRLSWLDDLVSFTKAVLSQHMDLVSYNKSANSLLELAESLITSIQQDIEEVNVSRRESLGSRVSSYGHDLLSFWSERGATILFPICNDEAKATRLSSSDDGINIDLLKYILDRYKELQDKLTYLNGLLLKLDTTSKFKELGQDLLMEARQVSAAMEDLVKVIRDNQLDIDALECPVSKESLKLAEENGAGFLRRALELSIEPLIKRFDEHTKAVSASCCDTVDQADLINAIKALSDLSEQVSSASAEYSSQVKASKDRLEWELMLKSVMEKLEIVQKALNELSNRKNNWIEKRYTDPDDTSIHDIYSNLLSQQKCLNESEKAQVIYSYNRMIESYKSGLPSFSHRQEDFEKLWVKLDENINLQLSEVNFLIQRHNWECKVDNELEKCQALEATIESFIQSSARWSQNRETLDLNDTHESVENEVQTIQALQSDFSLLQHSCVHLQNSLLLNEATFKKKATLEQTVERIRNHEHFAQSILDQSKIISSYISHINGSNDTARSLESRFLEVEDETEPLHMELLEYRQQMEKICHEFESTITYPVRHYRDHNSQAREQDVCYNTMVCDIIKSHRSRLDEFMISLDSILKTKERMSRLKMLEDGYMIESKEIENLLQTKLTAVDSVSQIIESVQPSSQVDFIGLHNSLTQSVTLQSEILEYRSIIDTLKESSRKTIGLINQQKDEINHEEARQSIQRIESTQRAIDNQWSGIVEKIQVIKSALTAFIKTSEFLKWNDDFNTRCSKLLETITTVETGEVTEAKNAHWEKEICDISEQFITPSKFRLNEIEERPSQQEFDLSQMVLLFEKMMEDHRNLKDTLKQRVIEAKDTRLKDEYFSNALPLEESMRLIKQDIFNMEQSCGYIRGTIEDDKGEVDKTTQTYQEICIQFEQLTEKYDEQRSFYRFLQLNKVSQLETVNERQLNIEQDWKQLKSNLADDKDFVDCTKEWFNLASAMDNINRSVTSISDGLIAFDSLESDTLPEFFKLDSIKLNDTEVNLDQLLTTMDQLSKNRWNSPSSEANFSCLKAKHRLLKENVESTKSLLSEKQSMAQAYIDRQVGLKLLQEVQSAIEIEISKSVSRIQSIRSDNFEDTYQQAVEGLSTSETRHIELTHYSKTMVEPFIEKLPDNTTMLNVLLSCISNFDKQLESEHYVNELIKGVIEQCEKSRFIENSIDHCHELIKNLYTVAEMSIDESEIKSELDAICEKMDDLDDDWNKVDALNKSIKFQLSDGSGGSVSEMLFNITENNKKTVDNNLERARSELKEAIQTTEKISRGILLSRKMKGLMELLGDSQDLICNLRVFEALKYSSSEHHSDLEDIDCHNDDSGMESESGMEDNSIKSVDVQVLTDVEQDSENDMRGNVSHGSSTCVNESMHTIQPLSSMLRVLEVEDVQSKLFAVGKDSKLKVEEKMNEIKALMMEETSPSFATHYNELEEAVSNYYQNMMMKHSEVERALDIGRYLYTADEIETQQAALEEALGKAGPHHATLMSISRTDLQAKLIELDARFKYYEAKIIPGLNIAHNQAAIASQHEEGTEIEMHLEELRLRWETIRKLYKSRKIELSRTIDTSMDQKEQRIRKSSLPTRKASSLLRDRADSTVGRHKKVIPTSSSTTTIVTVPSVSSRIASSSSSSNSSQHLQGLTPRSFGHRYLSAPNQNPSKSTSVVKSQSKIIKTPLNSYVADPKNDLDIEIGRIVNETPYRVKVKMVPGEVGRYWFGDINPKLAYCRVLKSKMVMVRVGGGWTELSQFLRDHALLEGEFIPRSARNNRMVTEEEDEPSSIQEGYIETRRAQLPSGKPVPRHGNASPNTQNSSSSTSGSNSSYVPTGSPSNSAGTQQTGYKEGDTYIAVDQYGNQREVKMRAAPTHIREIANNGNFSSRRIPRLKESPSE
ncbi:hypothetical protein K501DRAFT_336083 [Backusella circina FSU 941]|nr:hypothetical protein K501DRAFT_336083 [Backusella circina FSU 941]